MAKRLSKTEFGNPILRETAKVLSEAEIVSKDVQTLIADMYAVLENRKYGVGIAAPQIGHSLAINVIDTKPTATRPDLERQKLTIINPTIIKYYGRRKPMWEACLSGPNLYAQVPRYKKVRLRWHDQHAVRHEKDFDGFMAHVIQHEVDHLHGVLFVDRVKDTKTYMTTKEYIKFAKATR
jgi:peptide deformylase